MTDTKNKSDDIRLLPETMPEVEETQVALSTLPANEQLAGPEPTKDLISWIEPLVCLTRSRFGRRTAA